MKTLLSLFYLISTVPIVYPSLILPKDFPYVIFVCFLSVGLGIVWAPPIPSRIPIHSTSHPTCYADFTTDFLNMNSYRKYNVVSYLLYFMVWWFLYLVANNLIPDDIYLCFCFSHSVSCETKEF